ncbi:MAG: hypothetical protein FRX48_06977 [Lasallia pustulata]|uniref:Caleosin n=1 Tax=Lasallia pustulata TaxID=136370 RepID=A0A5M8PLP1_9LECA|nr:MAG: hypothetical protein FRX48_06977 [Lasallia pustulata]
MPGRTADAHDGDPNPKPAHAPTTSTPSPSLLPPQPAPSALQSHVLFWDRDADNIITPTDVYTGFRSLGFSVPFSLGSLLIPLFFSYPTRLAHSWIPDPLFRIHISSIHKAKHGSDTGIYDNDGRFRPLLFEELFAKFDGSGVGGLSYEELGMLLAKDRCAADPAGWSFAFMEWWTTWLLLQKEGRVWKEDLRQCYDGSLFWRIREERAGPKGWTQGYGWKDFFKGLGYGGTWKEWKVGKGDR